MRKYLIEVIIIMMIIFMVFWAYVKFTLTTEVRVESWRSNQTFGVVVDEFKWEGQLQPGRYTKNGVLIIKQ
jgi:hypothetical protein